jgi:NAD(P)-dependent dehydrogenase (short-subunit alcohol dehydrogenase family)
MNLGIALRGIFMVLSSLLPDSVAVITGGASGIGLAAAKRFASRGLRVCIADIAEDRLVKAAGAIAGLSTHGAGGVMTIVADVSRKEDLQALDEAVCHRFGGIDVLMNNAGVQPGSSILGGKQNWEQVIGVNLWGVINGTRILVPGMVARGRPGFVINTGSKQGITTPPGDPAYNVSKAGLKAFTEALQHELRNTPGCGLTAHLLIPGFVFTPLAAGNRSEKPDAAWTPEQTVEFMMDRLAAGDFYILCPDNDVTRALDEKRILWAAGDIVENRPALSRWHPDYAEKFKAFVG